MHPIDESPRIGEIVASLTEVAARSYRPRERVFEDFLDYAAAVLSVAPVVESIRNSLAEGHHFLYAIDSSPEFLVTPQAQDLLERYRPGDLWGDVSALFRKAFESILRAMTEPTENGRSFISEHDLDVFGYIYQNVLHPGDPLYLSRFKQSIAQVLRTIPNGTQLVFSALERAISQLEQEGDPFDAMMARTAVAASVRAVAGDWRAASEYMTDTVIPLVRPYLNTIAVQDPACGSGVLLLAASQRFPAFAVEHGLVKFTGMDIDPLCVKMAHLNEVLYGLNGYFEASAEGAAPPPSLIFLTTEEDLSAPRFGMPEFQSVVKQAQGAFRYDRPGVAHARIRRLAAESRQLMHTEEMTSRFPAFTVSEPWGKAQQ